MNRNLLRGLAAALMVTAALPARPASIEDTFRAHLDRLRAAGRAVREAPLALGQREITRPVLHPRVDDLPLGRDQYVVFVAPGCRSCSVAVQQLRDKGLQLAVLDIARSATAREAFAHVGGQGVPTLLVGNYRLSGYSQKAFNQAVVQGATDYGQQMKGQGS